MKQSTSSDNQIKNKSFMAAGGDLNTCGIMKKGGGAPDLRKPSVLIAGITGN